MTEDNEVRLIDADKLKKAFAEYGEKAKFLQDFCQKLIDNAPTVESDIESDIEVATKDAYEQGYTDGWKERFGEPDERPHGEWKMDSIGAYCSNCHTHPDFTSNFCPFCGADMRGKKK